MKNNFLSLVANVPQNTGGGNSQTKRATLALPLRYLCTMLLALVLGVGQMWGDTFTAAEIIVQNEGKTAVIGTTKNHVTVYSPGITSTGNNQIWMDGSTKKKEATVVISADASNSDLQNRSGSYIEIKADDGYTLGTTIGIRGGSKNSSAKIAPIVWWSGSVSSTFTGAKLDLSLPANTITSSAAADLVVTIPSGMKVVRIYRKVRLKKDSHDQFVTSNYDDIGGGSAAISSVTATAVSSGPSVSGFSPATGATVGASQEITITGSTGSTVYYKWATSAQTADAIYNSGSGDHGTADAASATTTVESGKTLYAIARKGTTNSTVASASYTVDATAPAFVSSIPANSATDVATNGTIVLTFDEEIDAVDDSKFTLTGATIGTVAVDGSNAKKVNVPYSDAANGAVVTLSVAAGAVEDAVGNKSAALSNIAFTTVAAETPVCPSGMSISGTAAYTEGQTITLNAALSAGNGDITYTWYKGTDLATAKSAGSIGTGTSYTKANCVAGDAGNYWCEATKDECTPASNAEAYAVTVEEKTCPTSGVIFSADVKVNSNQSFAAGSITKISSDQADVTGGEIYAINEQGSAKNLIAPQSSVGYFCHTNNNTYFKIELECALAEGDRMTAKGYGGTKDGDPNNKGIWVSTATSRPSSAPAADGTSATASLLNPILDYTITSTDEYVGKKTIYVYRAAGASTYFDEFTITRPYAVTFVSDHGTVPTTPAKAISFTLTELSDASFTHTGWTADKAVKVGGETKAASSALAVDATVELTDNTTFTATWEAKAATFAVTYKANNGTSEADINDPAASTFAANTFTVPDGKIFAGWNTKADGEGTNYAVGDAVTAAITVYAKWVVDPTIRLILKSGDTYSINTDKFTVYEGTELQNEEYTVDGRVFAKNFKFGGNCSSTPFAGQAWSNKFMAYDVASNSTDIKLYVYNKNNSNKKLYYQIVPEGSAAAAFQYVTITSKATNQVVSIPTITAAKGARVLFGVEAADVRICQIEVLENGTALPAFGTNGYEFSVPGRAATYNKVGAFDGFEFKTNADLKFISGQDYIALRNIDGSQYVKFTVATNIQLQVTTPNANKFYVSKTAAGDAEKDTKYGGSAATHNVNLHAGTYYIAPAAGSSDGEVRITKLAFATAPGVKTVNFNSNGGSSIEAQEVFAGEKAVEPTTPTKSGYRFVEWQLSGSAYDFDEAVTTDIELDAVWQKTWTVTFDSDGGSAVAAATVDDGQAVAKPADPTKDGFDFVEWQLNSATYNFASAVEANITLVATWEVAQDDATLSALSYNGNAIDVASAEDVSGVQTYTYHLPWGSTINPASISVTKNAESATMSPITYNSEDKQATFQVTSGNGLVSVNYAIQFVIDAKRGTSIIKATTNNVITGIIGGTRDTNLGNGDTKKLNSKTYFGVTLANDETFQEGDVFIVNITTPADLGKFMIYADAERTELIADQGIVYTKPDVADPVICPTGEMMMTLPAAANGKKSLYLSREDGTTQWNPTFSYIEVTREMNPAIKSFKFGDDAATINESAKTITYEVAYGTDVTALTPTVEAYGNNGATYTPAGATDFTDPVVYTVTDGYNEFHTDYTVTVSKAAPSTNAYLASLSVAGYTLDFNKEEVNYNIVLDYGTTVLPTITYEVEEAGLATAVKVENGVNGTTTITVTPQAGAGYEKVYTINFSVSTTPKFVIYDGQKSVPMAAIATSGSDVSTGFAWTITGASNTDASNGELSFEGKTYSKYVNLFTSATKAPDAGNTRYITITIPDGYVAKFRVVGCGNGDKSRSSYISKEITGTLDQSIAYATTTANNVLDGRSSALQLPGMYYYCADNSIRLYELSVQLYPIDYRRDVTEGRYGTICLPNGGVMVGAELYEVAYKDLSQNKIFFDQIVNGEMIAGRPYVFLPKAGTAQLAVYYTDDAAAVAGNYHGLYGFIGASSTDEFTIPQNEGNYIIQNNQYREVQDGVAKIVSNRAYLKMSEIPGTAYTPLPGRKRMSIGAAAPAVATGVEDVQGDNVQCTKVLINGQLFILRGEKMYDAKGQLVK